MGLPMMVYRRRMLTDADTTYAHFRNTARRTGHPPDALDHVAKTCLSQQLLNQLPDQPPRCASIIQEILKDIHAALRTGRRWNELVHIFDSQEILLIGDVAVAPGSIVQGHINVGPTVIEIGSDKEYWEYKQALLNEEADIHLMCQRLGGVTGLLVQVVRTLDAKGAPEDLSSRLEEKIRAAFQ